MMTIERWRVVGTWPGPRSREMRQQLLRKVPNGLGVTLPVHVARAGCGVAVDINANQLNDVASGSALTSVSASAPESASTLEGQA